MSEGTTRVTCPVCGKAYRARPEAAGKSFPCTACGAQVTVPTGLAAPSGLQAPEPLQPYGSRPAGDQQPPASPPPPPPPQPQQPAPAGSGLPAQMRANLQIAGKSCPVCAKTIELGQPVHNCEQCAASHHEECWQSHGGCGVSGCANAPLPKMRLKPDQSPPVPMSGLGTAAAAGADTKRCPYCGEAIAKAASKCRFCKEYLPGTGSRTLQMKRRSDKATNALVCGILSLVCCNLIGPVAIYLASQAKKEIAASHGKLDGGGMATAGLVLGIISTALLVLGILVQVLGGVLKAV